MRIVIQMCIRDRFLVEHWSSCIIALILPATYVEEVLIITLSLAFLCLVLLTEVTTTALVAVQCIVSDQLAHQDEVTQVDSLCLLYTSE